jgi:hypothetical protein
MWKNINKKSPITAIFVFNNRNVTKTVPDNRPKSVIRPRLLQALIRN